MEISAKFDKDGISDLFFFGSAIVQNLSLKICFYDDDFYHPRYNDVPQLRIFHRCDGFRQPE